MPKRPKPSPAAKSSAPLGFEAKLWAAADALRDNLTRLGATVEGGKE